MSAEVFKKFLYSLLSLSVMISIGFIAVLVESFVK